MGRFFSFIAAFLGLALMGTVFIFCHDVLTQCEFFNIEHTVIVGNNTISEQEIKSCTGIHKGVNSLSVNLSLARKQLLSHPMVAEAEIRRVLPRTLEISIVEHTPVAIFDFGRKFLVNRKGEIFKFWESSDPDHLPLVSGLEFSDIDLAKRRPTIAFDAVMEVLALEMNYAGASNPMPLEKIVVDKEMGLTLIGSQGIGVIKLGFDDYPGKYKAIENVVHYLNQNQLYSGFQSVDLSNISRIVVTPTANDTSSRNPKEI